MQLNAVSLYPIQVYLIDMANEVNTRSEAGRRSYRSPRRAEQARATRRAIREAATRLFLEHGYAATRITQIASAAEVAPETVYATFKNKRALLKEAIDVAIAGDDDPVPVADRPWLDDVRAEPDPRRRTRMLSEDGFTRAVRVAPILEVLRSAAASDPDLARACGTRCNTPGSSSCGVTPSWRGAGSRIGLRRRADRHRLGARRP